MSKGVVVIPLGKFTSEADHKLVSDLATSVERNATLKALRDLRDTYQGSNPWGKAAREALSISIETIEQGRHVP